MLGLLFVLFVLSFPFIGYKLGKWIGSLFSGTKSNTKEKKYHYTDNSVHHHYHTHEYGEKKVINENHLHQNLTVIDEETHRKGMEKFKKKNNYENTNKN